MTNTITTAERTTEPAFINPHELSVTSGGRSIHVTDDSDLAVRVSAPNGGSHHAEGGMVLILLDVDNDHDHVRVDRGYGYDDWRSAERETLREAIRVAQQALDALERVAQA